MTADWKRVLTETPKAELHVHFEGTVCPKTLLTLCAKNDLLPASPTKFGDFPPLPPPAGTAEGCPQLRDFNDFIGLYVKIADAIRSEDDVITLGDAYLASARAQGIIHSEIYFTPSTFVTLGRDIESLFRGLIRIQERAQEQHHQIAWIFDIVRNLPSPGFDTIELAEHARSQGVNVKAIGLAGFEAAGPARRFVDAAKLARQKGFEVLAHAGETAGAESVSETIDLLEPLRIGHGVRAIEDPALLRRLRVLQIPLEVSPWSNILLGVFSAETHPLAQLINEGLRVVIASDDPGIFQRDLLANYYYAASQGVPPELLIAMAEASISYAVS